MEIVWSSRCDIFSLNLLRREEILLLLLVIVLVPILLLGNVLISHWYMAQTVHSMNDIGLYLESNV